ncbi:sigma-54-dependent Fis family transcriptional regulator [Glacieibacterium frigidum]|uniref:Sigma-54-dependent Fis family transcriptional regulator n=2 Tax=Glacieibacterium frigidum TaxID=2593303 RepID=A0A552U790_9SPHN|nr:sigma-54-dependent Fis family transcriptional regulator [Glacieibacterium frigidum]
MGATRRAGSIQLAEMIGTSAVMRDVRDRIDRVASSAATVLLTGPSGSGKDVVARLLHQRGTRAAAPFIAVNCGAVPAELIESEIFGHEAGAFTGAARARCGRFEAADTGTLFLDEVGDMPAAMQVKLLRVLETRVVERVGGMIGVAVDVRLVAATNLDLDAAIAAGRFREDLFYRLAVVEIRMPALSERRDDIPLLIEHFAAGGVGFTRAALRRLAEMPWRGNVRELRNLVERAVALHGTETLDADTAEALTEGPRGTPWPPAIERRTRNLPPRPPVADDPGGIDLKRLLDEVEQTYIEQALSDAAGGIAESARRLGLRRTTLIEKMRRLNIVRLPVH